jgi:uncharacterized protein (TIRG00374 family)
MPKYLRTILQYLFFLGIGIFFAWLSLKNLDKDKISKIKVAFANGKHWLIIPVFIILFLSHYVRALRWRLLIQPLGYSPTRLNAFFAVMIGYLVNQGVPRLGEVMKCTILGRYEKIPTEKLIGTIILERIMHTFFNQQHTPAEKKKTFAIILYIIIATALISLGIWMYIRKKTVKDITGIFKKVWNRIAEGVGAIKHLKKRKQFIFLTVALWTLYLAGGYVGFMAFHETEQYGIKEAFTILSAGSIGMIASPGGLGAYALLIEETMLLYGLNGAIATAFGWILWLATTSVIIIGGLISFVALPYYNKKRKQ